MEKIRLQVSQKDTIAKLLQTTARGGLGVFSRKQRGFEIGGQPGEFGDGRLSRDQLILITIVHPGEGVNQVPDVGSDAKVGDPAGIECDPKRHWGMRRRVRPWCAPASSRKAGT